MDNLMITISKASDEGYFYDIYLNTDVQEASEREDSDDGGQCTSENIQEALLMAYEQARELIANKNN